MYFQRSNTAGVSTKVWTKGKNDGRDDDWVLGMRCLSVTITRAMMTDGGSTTGTYDLAGADSGWGGGAAGAVGECDWIHGQYLGDNPDR